MACGEAVMLRKYAWMASDLESRWHLVLRAWVGIFPVAACGHRLSGRVHRTLADIPPAETRNRQRGVCHACRHAVACGAERVAVSHFRAMAGTLSRPTDCLSSPASAPGSGTAGTAHAVPSRSHGAVEGTGHRPLRWASRCPRPRRHRTAVGHRSIFAEACRVASPPNLERTRRTVPISFRRSQRCPDRKSVV